MTKEDERRRRKGHVVSRLTGSEDAMIWMMLIMILPLAGIGLFFVLPLLVALPLYAILFAVSATYHCLMMSALRLPMQMGPERMTGSAACVRCWEGRTGQVDWNGEIWNAETPDGTGLANGERVVIAGRNGLTLAVRSASDERGTEQTRSGPVDKCGLDRLLGFPHLVGRGFRPGGFEKVFGWSHRAEKLAR